MTNTSDNVQQNVSL